MVKRQIHETGSFRDRSRSQRPHVTTRRKDQHILVTHLPDRFLLAHTADKACSVTLSEDLYGWEEFAPDAHLEAPLCHTSTGIGAWNGLLTDGVGHDHLRLD
jgi:hypothetical protein